MRRYFEDISGDQVKLHVVSGKDTLGFQDEIRNRVNQTKKQAHRTTAGLASEYSLHGLMWDVEGASPPASSMFAGMDAPVDFSPIISTSGNELLEDLQNAHRDRGQFLLFLVMGLDGADELNPWVIHEHERVFRDSTSFVHVYTTVKHTRNFQGLKRYKKDKRTALEFFRAGDREMARSVMESMDPLLYFLDRVGWTYHTHVRPSESKEDQYMPTFVPEGTKVADPAYMTVFETAVLENQLPFSDVEKTDVVLESI